MTNNLPRGPEQKRLIASELGKVPDTQLACRLRHDWPSDKLQFGKPLPEGLRAEPLPVEGKSKRARRDYTLEDECQRCGKIRYSVWSQAYGVLDIIESWRYIDPKDWVRLSRDLELTKQDVRIENVGRCAGMLFGTTGLAVAQ